MARAPEKGEDVLFQVSVVQRERERMLQPVHLKHRVQTAVFLIRCIATKRPLFAENGHDRALHDGDQLAAIEEVRLLVKVDEALRPVADQLVLEKGRPVPAREYGKQVEFEPGGLRQLVQAACTVDSGNARRTGLERRKCGIIGAVADCAFTSLHSLIPSRAWLRLGLATGSGLDAPDDQERQHLPRIRRIRSIQTAIFIDTAGATETKSLRSYLCCSAYKIIRKKYVTFIPHGSHAAASN